MAEPDIEKLCERLDPEAATALRSVHARAVKAEEERDEASKAAADFDKHIGRLVAQHEARLEDSADWKISEHLRHEAHDRALTAEAALADAQAAVKVLREAVDPLANETDQVSVWNGTSHEVVLPPAEDRAPAFNIFYGDIRRARAALAQTAGEGE